MRFASYADALRWLESHVDFERLAPNHQLVPSLEPIRDTLAQFADPQRDYPTIHITGTNGKGTTTTLTSALLGATGLRVGTFTSPDLHAVNERIAVNGQPISDDDLIGLMERLSDVEVVTGIALTRFELLTVGALLHFSDEAVDVGVIEVGMGGTWDSTNVIDSDVEVLTNVDLDHTAVLGPTISAIAHDKVGIFRTGSIAIVATTNAIVVEIAMAKSEELDTTLWLLGDTFVLEENELALGGRAITVTTPYERYDEVLVTLHGIHQGVNAATAIVTAEAFSRSCARRGRRPFYARTRGHARPHEILARNPMIVVDGAHNPAGIRALVATLDGAFDVHGVRRCVIGLLSGRDLDDMVAPLVGAGFTEFHCCAPQSPRGVVPVEELAAALRRNGGGGLRAPDVQSGPRTRARTIER